MSTLLLVPQESVGSRPSDSCVSLVRECHGRAAMDRNLDDSEDEDYDPLRSQQSQRARIVQDNALAQAMLESAQAAADVGRDDSQENWYEVRALNILDYLQRRHGFHARHGTSWTPQLHGTKNVLSQTNSESSALAAKSLLHPFPPGTHTSVLTSVLDFYNTVTGKAQGHSFSYIHLPPAWDISHHMAVQPPLTCNMAEILLEKVSYPDPSSSVKWVYILQPPRGSRDPSPWFIATPSATAVLLVYWSPWRTMTEICCGLLGLGIPFRTVVESTTQPPA